jgi:signal-transduction protein with cAMP-binding, CBS, and nucleotidyltransferase domain
LSQVIAERRLYGLQVIDKAEILKRSLIFSGLNEEELAEVAGLAIDRSFTSGEFVFWDGDPPNWFYIIAQGRVKVLKHSSLGKEFIIAFFGPGEMFGEVAVFEDKPYPASAQAVTETEVQLSNALPGHSLCYLQSWAPASPSPARRSLTWPGLQPKRRFD